MGIIQQFSIHEEARVLKKRKTTAVFVYWIHLNFFTNFLPKISSHFAEHSANIHDIIIIFFT